jgi:putative transferase (TIGR04331 family)
MTAKMENGGRLHLVPPKTGFDPDRDFCLDPRFKSAGNLSLERHPYRDQTKLAADAELVSRFANWRCLELCRTMDTRHGTSLGTAFWRTVLIRWMFDIAQSSWQRHAGIENAVDLLRDRPMEVQVCRDGPRARPENNTEVAYRLLHDSRLKWWIDSLFLAELAPDIWTLSDSDHETVGIPDFSPPAPPTEVPDNTVRRVKRHLGVMDSVGTRWGALIIAAITRFGPKAAPRPPEREQDSKPEGLPESFTAPFEKILEALLPHSLDDNVPKVIDRFRNVRFSPGRVRIGALDGYNDRQKVEVGLAKTKGERLLQTQHGGYYGVLKSHPAVIHIEYREDAFLSWGFTEQNGISTGLIPAPSPLLSSIRNRHRSGDRYLFVGTDIQFDNLHLTTRPRGPAWFAYVDWKRQFLSALPDAVTAAVDYRPDFRVPNDLDDVAAVREIVPDMPLAKGNMIEWFLSAKAVILDHPGTTMNQCFASATPTICYWNPDDWTLDEAAEPFFDDLRRAGILHDDPASAAAHLTQIDDDIAGWWSSPEVAAARDRWARQFARTSRFWLLEWIAIYLRFVRQSRQNANRTTSEAKERTA